MKKSTNVVTDPICGMMLDIETAYSTEHGGKTAYFCSDLCRQIYLLTPENELQENRDECCHGSLQHEKCCGRHQHAVREEKSHNNYQQISGEL
ncbi:MAG: YHS domain-containing protein [bacterium]|nr:YHS domain-containing protein [bacterium]